MKTVEERLDQWRQQLLDLSNRNALLSFRFSTARPSSLPLVDPDAETIFRALVEGESLEIVGRQPEGLDEEDDGARSAAPAEAGAGTARPLPPGTARASLPHDRVLKVALRLAARARSSEQEQGVNTLFAAFGMLRWQEQPGESDWRTAPLLLLPVRLREHPRKDGWIVAGTGDEAEFNVTLGERLRRDFGLSLTDGEEQNDGDDAGSLRRVLDRVAAAVASRTGWSVLPEVYLGIFQFHKLRMYADLGEHAAVAAGHEVVQALALDNAAIRPLPDGLPAPEELDRALPPEASFTVLDADAAQLRVAAAVQRGGHVIVVGPPGTGKSQTIANVIAEAMAEGKTVLFVSEKAAAIEVVHRRLAAVGLDDLCLMLHSHQAAKRQVVLELGQRLDALADALPMSDDRLLMSGLAESRANLDAYQRALHEVREPLGRSAFSVIGELAAMGDDSRLRFPVTDPAALTVERLESVGATLDEAARFSDVLAAGEAHPWAGVDPDRVTIASRGALRAAIDDARRRASEVRRRGGDLAAAYGAPAAESLASAEGIAALATAAAALGGVDARWLDPVALDRRAAMARDAGERLDRLAAARSRVAASFSATPPDLDLAEAIRLYEAPLVARIVSPAWWSLRRRLQAAAAGGWPGSTSAAVAVFGTMAEVGDLETWWAGRRDPLAAEFGQEFPGDDAVRWHGLTRRAEAVAALLDRLPSRVPPAAMVARLSGSAPAADREAAADVQREIDRLRQDLRTVTDVFGVRQPIVGGGALADATFADLEAWLDERSRRFDEIDRWIQARRAMADAEAAGAAPVVAAATERGLEPAAWRTAYRRHVLTEWLATVFAAEPVLARFDGESQTRQVARFRAHDLAFLAAGARRVRAEAHRQTRHVAAGSAGEPQVLRHEYRKTRRHMPLRRLFERIPNLLPTLKPCLMMSPLSVAQFLPADRYAFDLVIFDEASQVRPHDAIGAIMRGRQLVVAGDNRQLPPTTFFDRVFDDPDADDDLDIRALESVLDALDAKGMPRLELLWHYRSRDEHLIAWSNHHIYGGRLVTFPNPTAGRTPGRGVRFEHVSGGVYEDTPDRTLGTSVRVNAREADRVVELVTRHAREHPERSLGVVALGITQRDLLDERLREACANDDRLDAFCREDRQEPFFVKALEQVQGDERDTILISIGYARDARGVLSHNFGPINQEGGERRLNVLVTRARQQVIVVSSIRGADIDLSRTSKTGPRLLKNYLDFAEHGPEALASAVTGVGGEAESPFEEQVAAALERAGWTVHRQVGVSRYRIDLAVVDPARPGRYLLGIECDGATYHSLKTVRDRDRLRQEVLEGLGWRIHRVWSTEWFKHPERELGRIVERLAADDPPVEPEPPTFETPEPPAVEPEHPAAGSASLEPPAPTRPGSAVVPYRVATIPVVSPGDLPNAPIQAVMEAVVACAEGEGPIHADLLTRRLAAAWGHGRMGSRIAGRLADALAMAERSGRVRKRDAFVWPANPEDIAPRAADADGVTREIGHIAPEERLAAFRVVLRQALSLPPDELVVQTARAFGYARTGAEIERELRRTMDDAIAAGDLVVVGERVQAPD